MRCSVCAQSVPPGTRGQSRTYCSTACRKQAELDARRQHKLERFEAAIGDVLTREQVLILLSAAACAGSVLAAKTMLVELRRDDEDASGTPSIFDELAHRRRTN